MHSTTNACLGKAWVLMLVCLCILYYILVAEEERCTFMLTVATSQPGLPHTVVRQERIMLYLRQYIGSLNTGDLEQFLRFVTGSCVFMPVKIQVSFNSLSGTARRPIAHTCEPSLELSSTYVTYLEFAIELKAVMNVSDNSPAWAMNAL